VGWKFPGIFADVGRNYNVDWITVLGGSLHAGYEGVNTELGWDRAE